MKPFAVRLLGNLHEENVQVMKKLNALAFLALIATWDRTSGISVVSTATTPSGISSSPVTLLASMMVGLLYTLLWVVINSLTETIKPHTSTGLITCQLLETNLSTSFKFKHYDNEILLSPDGKINTNLRMTFCSLVWIQGFIQSRMGDLNLTITSLNLPLF